jgi:hypothetical protein
MGDRDGISVRGSDIIASGRMVTKGIAFGLIAWFFRVAMGSASQAVMFQIPSSTVLYGLCSGLTEMIVLGLLHGALLRPR